MTLLQDQCAYGHAEFTQQELVNANVGRVLVLNDPPAKIAWAPGA